MPSTAPSQAGTPSGTSTSPSAQRLVERLRHLRRGELLGLYDAALEAVTYLDALAKAGKNPVTKVLGDAPVVNEWAHFPPGDVIDASTCSQYYYHAHAAEERVPGEHGHFHTFLRAETPFPTLRQAAPVDATISEPDATSVTHLIGISTDASGWPIRLFTTNRWVTDEVWYQADDVIGMLDRFDMTVGQPSYELNRWVTAIVRLFRPQIVDLIRARDEAIAQLQVAHPQGDAFEDRDLQVISQIAIDFLAQVRAIEAALAPVPAQYRRRRA